MLTSNADLEHTESAAQHEAQILAEQQLAETKALLEADAPVLNRTLGFFQTLQRAREAARCTVCGKTRFVFNAARRGYRAEPVTVDSHCTCVDGPAHHLLASAGSGAES